MVNTVVYEVLDIKCKCVNTCKDMDIEAGKTYYVDVRLLKTGETVFVVKLEDGSKLKCVQDWFADYFEITK